MLTFPRCEPLGGAVNGIKLRTLLAGQAVALLISMTASPSMLCCNSQGVSGEVSHPV